MRNNYFGTDIYIVEWNSGKMSKNTKKPLRSSKQIIGLEQARAFAKEKKDAGFANIRILH